MKEQIPDSSRSLIQNYLESEWRTTRLEMIQNLSRFQDSRSLHFLIDIVLRNEDLAEQNLAIRSLGLSQSRGAKLFLTEFYLNCDATLKASAALALGQCGVRKSAPVLIADLDRALASRDGLWAKNLILALGELKTHSVIPKLYEVIETSDNADLKMAVLFSLGRLERNLDRFRSLEALSFTDSLIAQVYQATLSQIQIRSQLKLEDYLEKIFENEKPHPALPFELISFDGPEVKEGLELFRSKEHLVRFAFLLKALAPDSRALVLSWITEWKLSRDEWLTVFQECVKHGVELEIVLEKTVPELATDLELRLTWIETRLESTNFEEEAKRFLVAKDENLAIRFLNLWNEWGFAKTEKIIAQNLKMFLSFKLSDAVYGRLLRACSELQVRDPSFEKEWATLFSNAELRSSLLFYAEAFRLPIAIEAIVSLPAPAREGLARRVLEYFEALASETLTAKQSKDLELIVAPFLAHSNAEWVASSLRVVRAAPLPSFEALALKLAKSLDLKISTSAVIALKGYPNSREASEVLADMLESESEILRARVLDSLCSHTTLFAKRGVIAHLQKHLNDEVIVDKIYRCFDPEKKGGEEFETILNDILRKNPDHPQWEKLVYLRDRLRVKVQAVAESTELPALVKLIDERLLKAIPQFQGLDAEAKLALRAAEEPFLRDEDEGRAPIDKAPTVLEFCKALDLILDRSLGQKHLFPKLDRELHDFQTLWHRAGFGEDYPQADIVLTKLGLKGKLAPELFPLHKAKMICGSFFNGKIVQDRFKIFDGLRAWAVIFLVFARKVPGTQNSLLNLPKATDEKCITVAKRLMQLQDLRNPAAHRQTYLEISSVQNVRREAIAVMNTILEIVL